MRLLFIMVLAGWALLSWSLPSSAADFPTTYDRHIKGAVHKFWPRSIHWVWWKAQLYQESRLDPDAVSPVGARGLAQFMPGTWDQVSRQLNLKTSPHVAKPAIRAGAYYMASLAAQWSARRPQLDRWDLARASYNAGLGNILKAQKRCGGRNLYHEIIACLPDITGRHSVETITYNKRIHRWNEEMMICSPSQASGFWASEFVKSLVGSL